MPRRKPAIDAKTAEERAVKKRITAAAVRASLSANTTAGSVRSTLRELEEENLLTAPAASSIKDASYRLRQKWRQESCHSIALPQSPDSLYDWVVSSPLQVLATMARELPAHCSRLQNCLARTRDVCIAIYADEVVPGNVLAPDPQRRTMAIYFAVLGLGAERLRHPSAWLPVAMLRSHVLKKVPGGFTVAFKKLLESWSASFDGAALQLGNQVFWTRLRLNIIVGDEAALAAMLSVKGASGRKPCWLCADLLSRDAMTRVEPGRCWETLNSFVPCYG